MSVSLCKHEFYECTDGGVWCLHCGLDWLEWLAELEGKIFNKGGSK